MLAYQTREHDILRELIIKARSKSGLHQLELSLKLGKPRNYMHKVEHAKRGIDLVDLLRLLEITGTDREAFFRELFERVDSL